MNRDEKQQDLQHIPMAEMITLAIEHWRLCTWLATTTGNTGIARHALRRMADVLARWQIEARSLDDQPFDAGLAAKVVDIIDDPGAPKGQETVDETVSPLVIWQGKVIRPAEIVVRRGSGG